MTALGAYPCDSRLIVDGADRLDIAIVFWSHIGHSSPDVHPSKVYTVGPIRCLSLASGGAGLVPDAACSFRHPGSVALLAPHIADEVARHSPDVVPSVEEHAPDDGQRAVEPCPDGHRGAGPASARAPC